MKFAVISDIHIHNYKKFDENGSRLFNCLRVIEDVFVYANTHSMKYILISGDLYDQQKSLPTVVVNATIHTFKLLFSKYPNIEVIAISGNHDQSSKNLIDDPAITALSHLDVLFDRFHLIDNSSYIIEKNAELIEILGIPYYSHKEHFLSKIDNQPVRNKSYLMIHQTPKHSNPMIPHDFIGDEFPNFDYVFCGHIHRHEQISNNVVLVGSPLHRDLGDEGQEKGFLVFDTDNNSYERVILSYPKIKLSNDPDPFNYTIPVLDIGTSEEVTEETDIELSDSMTSMVSSYLSTQDFDEDQLLDYYEIGESLL